LLLPLLLLPMLLLLPLLLLEPPWPRGANSLSTDAA